MQQYEITLVLQNKNLVITLDVSSTFKEISEFLIEEGLILSNGPIAYFGCNSKKLSENQSDALSTIISQQNDTVKVLIGNEIENHKNPKSDTPSPEKLQQNFVQEAKMTNVQQQQQQQINPNSFQQQNISQDKSQSKIIINVEVQDGSQRAKLALQMYESQTLNDLNKAIMTSRGIMSFEVAQAELFIGEQPYNNSDKRIKTFKQLYIQDQTTMIAKIRWNGGEIK